MTSTDRDFAAEYLAACLEARRPTADVNERAAAHARCDEIAADAEAADVFIDTIDIDEEARVALHGTYVWTPAATS